MKEIIIVAGKGKQDIEQLRSHLKIQGYDSILCKTVKDIIGELKILPVCDVRVPLVIIETKMLITAGQDLITELSEWASNVPFVLFDGDNTLPSVEKLISGSMQHLTITGSELPGYIFATQCIKILEFAEAELSDLDNATADAQIILTLSSAVIEIADLATQMVEPEVKSLAEKAIDLLEDIQLNKKCVMSNAHRESLFALIHGIKRHALNNNKTLTTNN